MKEEPQNIQVEDLYQEIEELLSSQYASVNIALLVHEREDNNHLRKIEITDTLREITYSLSKWDHYNLGYIYKRIKTNIICDQGMTAIDEDYMELVHKRTSILLNKWQTIFTLIEDRNQQPIWPEWWQQCQ